MNDTDDFTCKDVSFKCVKRRTKRILADDQIVSVGKRTAEWVGKGLTRAGKTTYMAFKIVGYTFHTGNQPLMH